MPRRTRDARERLIYANLLLELMASIRTNEPDEVYRDTEDILIICAVYVTWMAKRSLGGSKLSEMTGISRPTALRRLRKLVEAGIVEETGDNCFKVVTSALAAPEAWPDILRRARTATITAYNKLSNLDTKALS